MGLRETWNDMDTGSRVLVGLGVVLAGGVFLLLAIVALVVLAAVIASFVLGLGDSEAAGPEQPQVQLEFEYDEADSAVRITHDGGDSIDSSDLVIEVADRETTWDDPDGDVSAGDWIQVQPVDPGETVRIVWEGEDPAVLDEYEVPT